MRARTLVAAGLALSLAATACSSDSDDTAGGSGGTGGDGPTLDLPPCPVGAHLEADGPVEITVWHSQIAEPENTLEALVEEYNASQDAVRVSLESQGASYLELERKYVSAIPSGDLPDVVLFDDTATQTMAASGTVLPAQSCFDAEGTDLSVFDETAVAYYTIDGALYPGSVGLANILLFYNRNHFIAAGLDPDDPPETLDEMAEVARAIKDAGVVDTPIVHELASWKTEFWLTGAGEPIVDDDNGRGPGGATASAYDNDATRQLYQWFVDTEAEGLLLPVARAEGGFDHYLALANQNATMTVESSTAATSVEAFLAGDLDEDDVDVEVDPSEVDLSQLDIGAARFPGLTEPGRIQVGGWAWYNVDVGGDAAVAASWDFLSFLNTPAVQARLTVDASMLPWLTSAVDDPTVTEAWSSSLAGEWNALAYEQQLEGLDPAFPGPLIGPYQQTRTAIQDSMDDLLISGASVDEAIANATEDIDAALEQYQAEGF